MFNIAQSTEEVGQGGGGSRVSSRVGLHKTLIWLLVKPVSFLHSTTTAYYDMYLDALTNLSLMILFHFIWWVPWFLISLSQNLFYFLKGTLANDTKSSPLILYKNGIISQRYPRLHQEDFRKDITFLPYLKWANGSYNINNKLFCLKIIHMLSQ